MLSTAGGRSSIGGEDLHAPHLLDVEVLNALRRFVPGERLDRQRAAAFRSVLVRADIRRHPHTPLVDLIWSLRHRVTAYDAADLALATALDAPLVTTDRKLAKLPGLPCTVEIP